MNKDQQRVLDNLKKIPIIRVACQKSKVSIETYFEWIDKDLKFKQLVEECMKKGVENINDLAESKVISGIQDGDKTMTIFWLKNNKSENYIDKKRIYHINNCKN